MRITLGHVRALAAVLIALLIACPWGQAGQAEPSGKLKTYYIAADEVTWDYAPGGINQITGQAFGNAESFWVATGPRQLGRVLKKAQYREYTDGTFTQLKPRSKEWEHLGLLGPLLRAEVGDTIQVVFRNNLHLPVSMHPHGVFYERPADGIRGSRVGKPTE